MYHMCACLSWDSLCMETNICLLLSVYTQGQNTGLCFCSFYLTILSQKLFLIHRNMYFQRTVRLIHICSRHGSGKTVPSLWLQFHCFLQGKPKRSLGSVCHLVIAKPGDNRKQCLPLLQKRPTQESAPMRRELTY